MAPAKTNTAHLLTAVAAALLGGLLFFWALTHSDLSRREAREAIPVVHMLRGAGLALPLANDENPRTKPPAFYWASALIASLAGEVSTTTVRLTSVLAGAATVLLITLFGARLYSPAVGFLAGIILATSWRYAYLASHARVDMIFAFFVTGGFIALWRGLSEPGRGKHVWGAGIWLGLAMLAKGPPGWVLPLGALLVYCLWARPPAVPWGRLMAVPLGIFCVWMVLAAVEGGREFIDMVYNENVGRAIGRTTAALHRNPFYYYIPQLFAGLAPWSLFLPWALWLGLRRASRERSTVYLATAVGFIVIFFSLFPGKRGDYLLPLYPMAALLIAWAFLRKRLESGRGFTWPAYLLAALSAVLAAAVLSLAGAPEKILDLVMEGMNSRDRWMARLLFDQHLPGAAALYSGAAGLLAFTALFVWAARVRSRHGVCTGAALWAAALLVLVHGPFARWANEHSTLKPFAREVAALVGDRPVYFFGLSREDFFFYFNRPARPVVERPMGEAVRAFMADKEAYLLVRKPEADLVMESHPGLAGVLENTAAFEPYRLIAHAPPDAER